MHDLGVLFSELGGFAVFSPTVVARELAPQEGDDLASRLAADRTGDVATDRGVIFPVTLAESDDCRIRIATTSASGSGGTWPLRVEGRRLTVRTMASLLCWRAKDSGELIADVPDGWYSAQADLSVAPSDDHLAGLILALTLKPAKKRPTRTAGLDVQLRPSIRETRPT